MRRREFIAAVAGAVAGPLAAWAQQTPKIARIGFLVPSSVDAPASRQNFGAIRRQFAELGYLEGQNIIFEQRGADGVLDRLPAVAAELVSLKPDVVIALSTPAARAVQGQPQRSPSLSARSAIQSATGWSRACRTPAEILPGPRSSVLNLSPNALTC